MRLAIFVPGYIAKAKLYNKWLPKLAAKKGIKLLVHERVYSALIEDRIIHLRDMVNHLYTVYGKPIDLIGHSRGGTDITYTLHMFPELKDKVASVTTMAAPHGGARLAEYVQEGRCSKDFGLLNFLVDAFNEEATLNELTPKFMRSLKIKPVEGVNYHCFVFWARKDYMPLPGFIEYFNDTPSDGTVSIYSQSMLGAKITLTEACHKSQSLPFLYGPPIVRWLVRPYKKIWAKVFDHINSL